MSKALVGTAHFNKLGNDLFWEYSFRDDDYNFYKVKWTGYDDAYWWTEVAPAVEPKTIKVGNDTKTFEIDFTTNNVYLITCDVVEE